MSTSEPMDSSVLKFEDVTWTKRFLFSFASGASTRNVPRAWIKDVDAWGHCVLPLVAAVVCGAPPLVLCLVFQSTLLSISLPFVFLFVTFTLCAKGSSRWMYGVAKRRCCRELRDHEFRVCTNCGYPLTEHAGPARCPQCGVETDATECARVWKAWSLR